MTTATFSINSVVKETEKAILVSFVAQGKMGIKDAEAWMPKSVCKIEEGKAIVKAWFYNKNWGGPYYGFPHDTQFT